MAAVANGMALHGGIRPYCATFFSFSDYMKNAIRMSAIMELPVVYVLTHDSIGVGEDGPTHQPIEHLTGLRSMPVLKVFRPADGVETAAAYQSALGDKRPTAIVASRQELPALDTGDKAEFKGTSKDAVKGGYVVYDAKPPKAVIMAAGSEVSISIEAARILKAEGIAVRVLSMPCLSEFDAQSAEYRESVLPSDIRARVAVEAGSSMSWGKYVGLDGAYVCIDRFGESGKPEELFKRYGITPEAVVSAVKGLLNKDLDGLGKAKAAVQGFAEKVIDTAKDAAGKAKETAGELAGKAKDMAQETAGKAKDAADDVVEKAKETAAKAMDLVDKIIDKVTT